MSATHTTALQRIEELALSAITTDSRDRDDWKDDMLTISSIAHEALQQPAADSQKSSPEQCADSREAAAATHNRVTVDCGALQMALNVLRRAGKGEAADALEQSCGERGAATAAPMKVEISADPALAFRAVRAETELALLEAAATAAQPTLTPESIKRHALRASECPAGTEVLLVSSVLNLLGIGAGAAHG